MIRNAYETVILAGLLHDIGSFLQRGECEIQTPQSKHCDISSQFVQAHERFFDEVVDAAALIALIEKHHEGGAILKETPPCYDCPGLHTFACLLSQANRYSGGEQIHPGQSKPDPEFRALASIMCQMNIGEPVPRMAYYSPEPLGPESGFPRTIPCFSPTEITAHVKEFDSEFRRFAGKSRSFPAIYSNMLSLLQRFTWCIPSSTLSNTQDVSLYDHLKTTSALAATLYRYHEDTGNWGIEAICDDSATKFQLVVADFAGIQRYLFDIASVGVGGVAKRLRARSFFVSAMIDGIAYILLKRLQLPLSNIIMNSGGKFYLIAHNTEKAIHVIDTLQDELEDYLLLTYGGEITLNLGRTQFSGCEFNTFDRVMAEAARAMNVAKLHPFSVALTHDSQWDEAAFVRVRPSGKGPCPACRKTLTDQEGSICEQCRRDIELGTILPNARYITYLNTPTPSSFELLPGLYMSVSQEQPEHTGAELVMKLNDSDVSELVDIPVAFRFIANFVPLFSQDTCPSCRLRKSCQVKDEAFPSQPMFFDCLASAANGRPYLGYLKADVDNLGTLLIHGLRRDSSKHPQPISISRLSTFSRMLDLFFSGYLDRLLRSEFKLCYTVFSGGDDLFIVGPWDEAIRLATRIAQDFSRFTATNKNITLSAGINLARPRYPVAGTVRLADQALTAAKDTLYDDEIRNKDQLAVFGDVIKWGLVPSVLESASQLAKWLNDGIANASFVRNLLYYGELYRRYREKGDAAALKFLSLMSYDIGRNLPEPDSNNPQCQDYRKWAESLRFLDSQELKHLRLIASYALTYTRKDREGE